MVQSSNNIYDSHKNINIRYENSLILKNNSSISKVIKHVYIYIYHKQNI